MLGICFALYAYFTDTSIDDYKAIFIVLFSIIFIERAVYYLTWWKFIILPYSLNLHSNFKDDTSKNSLYVDKFVKFKKLKPKSHLEQVMAIGLKSFSLEYRNFVAINVDDYKENAERILHFLGLIDKRYEVKVYHKKNRNVVLVFYSLPYEYSVDLSYFKPNKLFLGIYEKGLYYRKLNTLDHLLCVGESGSGKSNFMHLLNINFLFNLHKIKKMYMIDLKGGVELKRYEKLDNVEFVSNIERLNVLLDDVLEDLKESQNELLLSNKRKSDDLTLIVFDEVGAVSTYPDKKIREAIFDKLALISMQGRASGILLFLFAQKIDNTILPSSIVNNLQTRVLLKTSNDNNINIIDLKDNIREKITWVEVQDFNKGRAIYKDGLTSDKSLIQFPIIGDKLLNYIISNNMIDVTHELLNQKPL
ncbi:FtsK/SpoIIIE domain-containing protein [Sulfurospirillum sp. UCH001]|uniref:FtsK/SpoIIIE domain-containing protein n=1 Tax=Sulfurospirillum sp. UCH001 TaxID=1581011 RepID=UPI00130E2CA7|nr:FtsK/SpoIIIE domain-containing protein [Sulfurospirillum sp. UCH001]